MIWMLFVLCSGWCATGQGVETVGWRTVEVEVNGRMETMSVPIPGPVKVIQSKERCAILSDTMRVCCNLPVGGAEVSELFSKLRDVVFPRIMPGEYDAERREKDAIAK